MCELPVFRRPRVSFFSTGDELRALGGALEIGEVYDSNRHTLHAMLAREGVEMVDLGIVGDDADALAAALTQAGECADMVITSAGASVGEADYVKEILTRLGRIDFWKVAVKPGRPLIFGRLRGGGAGSLFFGLPGNPVSVMVTFAIFVQPAIRLLGGESAPAPPRLLAKTASALQKRPGRAEYQRGILGNDADGLSVRTTGAQGSGILRSMGEANCFIILPHDSPGAAAGEWVEVRPFSQVW
ncbi:MAG: molybdopterin-binding protein [Gammaproteobacteria bacterium]